MKNTLLLFLFLSLSVCLTAQTQLEMNMEAAENYKKADAELNNIYEELIKVLDNNAKSLLKKAQLDWIKYRDSHCAFEGNMYEGGSAQPLAISMCLETVTRTRTQELQVSLEERSEK